MIGFVGMEDFINGANSLKRLLEDLEDRGCDIAICGCRTNNRIIAAVQSYPDHYLVIKTAATSDADERIVNVVDAERMITFI